MLSTIHIKNLAVIREIELQFDCGLTVLTGETGAGKSIVMDALQAILGARVSKDLIRADEKSALVEVSFFFSEETVPEALKPYLLDDMLVLSREIFRDGRNLVKINGSLSNTAELRGLAPYLISIHSQNDNQILFRSEEHFRFLDHFAGATERFLEYESCYRRYREISAEILAVDSKKEQDNSRIDYLKFVLSEIEAANLQPGEEDRLKEIKLLLKHQEKNKENIKTATYALYENEESAYHFVSVAAKALKHAEGFSEIAERLDELRYEIAELSEKIRTSDVKAETEYQNIDDLEDRLGLIYQLKMKYGGTVQSVFDTYERTSRELYEIEHREHHLEELVKQQEVCLAQLTKLSRELTVIRSQYAKKLSDCIQAELRDFMMPNAVFIVELKEESDFRAYGRERVEFLFSANLGLPPAPLSKIASGGEISRVNLALKSVLRGIDPACAFVFDEIDTGISGRAAQKTGEKMFAIASDEKHSQVLCVTHLPQIAAMADQHILVTKEEETGETVTGVSGITGEERISEIARMIGGVAVTEITRQSAEEMLSLAEQFKLEY
ncbi:MAG: DNA repair protein RecN [Clostridia bacterium]|nr:DNA repair protein RecN [Clostridia bacterium]